VGRSLKIISNYLNPHLAEIFYTSSSKWMNCTWIEKALKFLFRLGYL
jgi:hypothetical protein